MKRQRQASPEIRHCLAVNLKRLRKAKGYTQARLGRRVGLDKNYISNVEQETVNICLANLEALSKALECLEVDLLWPLTLKPRLDQGVSP